MKKLKYIICALITVLACSVGLILFSCKNDDNNGNDHLKTIEGITINSASYDYDGTEKEILINGNLPEGATVSYTNNKATNSGEYNVVAIVKCEGYKDLTLNATLTIRKLNYDMSETNWNYNQSFVFDGTQKNVLIQNLPEGVTIKNYLNNSKTNAGTYTASVTFNYDTLNHNEPKVKDLLWEIKKANITGIQFDDVTVEYDSKFHSITPIGNFPPNSKITITYNGIEVNSVSEVGTYNVKMIIENENYNTYEANAILKIISTEEQLYVTKFNDKIYFQNNLDSNKLYVIDGSNIKKVNNDIPKYFVTNGNTLYYYSSSLFSRVIKSYNGSTSSRLTDSSGEYLACDGTYLYYSVNNLLFNTDKNGIYKFSLTSNQDEPIRIVKDKAKYLTYYDGYIYYSNTSDGGKLYKISTSSNEADSGTLIWEEKVSYIVEDNGVLYFNSTKTIIGANVASSIRKYNISSNQVIKLTIDNGSYLTKIGNYIYYVNKDKITSEIFGDGIYKINSQFTEDNNSIGTRVISCEDGNGYSSLTSNGTKLYFYKLNDKHLYCYDTLTDSEVDLLDNFVMPVEEVTSTGYAKLAEYNGEIYYTNPLDDGCLYKYSLITKQKYKVLSNSVSNVYFYNGYMYYSTYISVQYAFWRMNLSTNEVTKISTSRCDNLIFDGDYIYYEKVGIAQTYSNKIMKMKLDGSDVQEVYSDKNLGVKSLVKDGNYLYFTINPRLSKKYLYRYNLTLNKVEDLKLRADYFIINNGNIYFNNIGDKTLCVYNISTKGTKVLAQNIDINNMIIMGNYIYYSSTETNIGFYKLNLNSNLISQISKKCADGMIEYNGAIYFIQTSITYTNDYPYHSNGNAQLFCYTNSGLSQL